MKTIYRIATSWLDGLWDVLGTIAFVATISCAATIGVIMGIRLSSIIF